MKGLLKEKSAIDQLIKEYQTLAEQNFKIETSNKEKKEIKKDDLVLDKCDLQS